MFARNPLAGGELGQRFEQSKMYLVALADNLAECTGSRNWWYPHVE
jgi:hypothetical protein